MVPAKLQALLKHIAVVGLPSGLIPALVAEESESTSPTEQLGEFKKSLSLGDFAISARADTVSILSNTETVSILSKTEKWRTCIVIDIDDEEDPDDPAIRVHYDGFGEEHD